MIAAPPPLPTTLKSPINNIQISNCILTTALAWMDKVIEQCKLKGWLDVPRLRMDGMGSGRTCVAYEWTRTSASSESRTIDVIFAAPTLPAPIERSNAILADWTRKSGAVRVTVFRIVARLRVLIFLL
jgi:hypothetical protein